MRRLSFLALAFILAPGCTTVSGPSVSVFHRFEQVDMSREFSSRTITSKSFAVHVVNIEGRSSRREPMNSEQATTLLRDEFRRERPDFTLADTQWTAAEQKTLTSILSQFPDRQELSAEGYQFLKKPALTQSWFLIADVEAVEDSQVSREEDIKDSKGHKIDSSLQLTSTRSVLVRFFVYDPAVGHLVFSGLIRSRTDAVSETRNRYQDTPYPDYPGLGKALAENFEKFLQALPASRG